MKKFLEANFNFQWHFGRFYCTFDFLIFYIYPNTKLFLILHNNNEKPILKVQNCHLMLLLKCLLLKDFQSFHRAFEMRRDIIFSNQFKND